MHPTSLPSGTRSLLITLTLVGLNLPAPAHDWPQWRGPDRDGRSRETNLLRKWPAEGPPLAWKVRNTGEGFSSLSIANGIIYTLGDLRDGCHVIALKEADGSPAWKTRTGESGGHRGYPGPRSTPTVDDGQIFALDQHSNLVCLNTGNGEKVWSVNLQDDFGGK
ncbi:MAG: PQQ-binding-like beta-propeller repeat protein, partial [Roseibacillus sp.]|nr:PQQ-binding-like beta-propeller repeat protein [Roseibacillus sp.]